MRIAYISLHWPRTHLQSVGKKIHEQLRAWQSAGHVAKLFMHSSVYTPKDDLIHGEVIDYPVHNGKLGFVFSEFERIKAAHRLQRTVDNFQPDLIYLRYGIYVYPIHQLIDLAPTIEEINTDDVAQHRSLGLSFDLYNRASRGILLRRVNGLVCVSNELAESPEFTKYHKPTQVISNGLALESIQPLPAPGNKIPRLIFMATPGYFWHGVDKIVTLAKRFPDLEIDLVGYHELPDMNHKPRNLRLMGYLNPQQYQMVLAQADLALSTFALHRKAMNEASPLKTRECLAYGLPVVLPYTDTDLNDLECNFLLKIPNREDNIETHGEMIHDFSFRMRGKRADRSLIATRIDLKYKEAMRLAFFEKIIKVRKQDHVVMGDS